MLAAQDNPVPAKKLLPPFLPLLPNGIDTIDHHRKNERENHYAYNQKNGWVHTPSFPSPLVLRIGYCAGTPRTSYDNLHILLYLSMNRD